MAKGSKQGPTFRSAAGVALTVVLLGGGIAGAVLGEGSLARRVGEARSAPEVEVQFNWPVVTDPDGRTRTWMQPDLPGKITEVALAHLTPDPLDAAALRRAHDALMRTGWFRQVRSVQRVRGGVVQVSVVWREPVAVVRHDGQDHWISADAERLPISSAVGVSGLPFVQSPYSGPPALGEAWLGGDVQAGLSLLAYVQASPAWDQVRGVDVGEYVARKRLALVTDRGTRVVWGVAPSDWKPGEPPAQTKLAHLLEFRADARFGRRIDAGFPVIDLTLPDPVIDLTAIPSPSGPEPAAAPALGEGRSDGQPAGGGAPRPAAPRRTVDRGRPGA